MQSTTKIRVRMKTERIHCIKYNYSLDDSVQTNCQQQGFIKLSSDGETLLIYKKHFIRPKEYILDPDFRVVNQRKQQFIGSLKKGSNG